MKEKVLVKKKVIQKAFLTLKRGLNGPKLLGIRTRTFKGLKSFFRSGENGRNMKRGKKCVAHNA